MKNIKFIHVIYVLIFMLGLPVVTKAGITANLSQLDYQSVISQVRQQQKEPHPSSVKSAYIQEAYLKASNTDAGDGFGFQVALSGNTMVVGAPNEDSNATVINGNESNNDLHAAGAAYVFTRSLTGVWAQQAYLKASSGFGVINFGSAVTIDGDTIIVGAEGDVTPNGATGAAYVFTRTANTWTQQAVLIPSNGGWGDDFGIAVDLSGNTVIIGASGDDSNETGINPPGTDNSLFGAGAAYIFVRNGSNWTQQAYIKASNTGHNDQFGRSVAIDADTVIIGAWFESSDSIGINADENNDLANQAGAAYVFTRSGTTWSQQAYLKASNTDAQDYFGISVAVSADTIAVGSPKESSNSAGINGIQTNNLSNNSGAVYVFTRMGNTWIQQAYVKARFPLAFNSFGASLDIKGNKLLVGADDSSGAAGAKIGRTHVLSRTAGFWSEDFAVYATNSQDNDRFGNSVALSGDIFVVGASFEDSNETGTAGLGDNNDATNSGAVYAFNGNGYYGVGGEVTGGLPFLSNLFLVLQNNLTDDIALGGNGAFSFHTALADGASYDVTVKTQPIGYTCVVTNGSGVISSNNVTNIIVNCNQTTYSVGGIVSGLEAGNSIAVIDGTRMKTISANGVYVLSDQYLTNMSYNVIVNTDGINQTCTADHPTGTINQNNITNVNINCIIIPIDTYQVGGSLVGLDTGNSITLQNNLTDDLVVSSNSSFVFLTALNDGSQYDVTIKTQPTEQDCVVNNSSGIINGSNIQNIQIICTTNSYPLSGNVAGLAVGKSFVVQIEGVESKTILTNGSFTFDVELSAGTSYTISVDNQPIAQTCVVNNGNGTMPANAVTNISITCVNNQGTSFSVGGSVAGLDAGKILQLRSLPNDILNINANGTFTFNLQIANGSAYNIVVESHPSAQMCVVANASGVIAGTDINSVSITCSSDALFKNGFEVSLKVFDYLAKRAKENPSQTQPNYAFETDSLWFKGYRLSLNYDYDSDENIQLIEYWLEQVIELENQ